MKKFVAAICLVMICAVLNRVRGDASWMVALHLHGRALYYATVLIGIIAGYVLRSRKLGLALAVTYLVWGVGPWGRWFDLGRLPDGFAREGIPMGWYESSVWYLSGHSDHIAMFIRHLNVLPGIILLSFMLRSPRLCLIVPVFSLAIVSAYELAWRLCPTNPIFVAELLVGALWGVFILLLLRVQAFPTRHA